mmetsp:Transcript_9620/g.23237  ORF Transcript_9620/g.23237 Transcript_9620/m.23237 type:complete len:243 (-) Transcript_9620:373-1101(-)
MKVASHISKVVIPMKTHIGRPLCFCSVFSVRICRLGWFFPAFRFTTETWPTVISIHLAVRKSLWPLLITSNTTFLMPALNTGCRTRGAIILRISSFISSGRSSSTSVPGLHFVYQKPPWATRKKTWKPWNVTFACNVFGIGRRSLPPLNLAVLPASSSSSSFASGEPGSDWTRRSRASSRQSRMSLYRSSICMVWRLSSNILLRSPSAARSSIRAAIYFSRRTFRLCKSSARSSRFDILHTI